MTIGTHVIADLYEVKLETFQMLNKRNYPVFDTLLMDELTKANMNVIDKIIHHFNDNSGAVTSLYLLAESHFSIHTWPEFNYIAIDAFTCGKSDTVQLTRNMIEYLQPDHVALQVLKRGENQQ